MTETPSLQNQEATASNEAVVSEKTTEKEKTYLDELKEREEKLGKLMKELEEQGKILKKEADAIARYGKGFVAQKPKEETAEEYSARIRRGG